jgi:2-(3-amino-3-carboxypropyl)histidine synthase
MEPTATDPCCASSSSRSCACGSSGGCCSCSCSNSSNTNVAIVDDPVVEVHMNRGALTQGTTATGAGAGTKKVINKIKVKKNQIPDSILNNRSLQKAKRLLPDNYNFEIDKSIWRIVSSNAKCVALQFPEGLLMYACIIADILEKFCSVTTIILGDVTYGACCVDDYTASKLGADFLIHYGHSCLVPISASKIGVMYVFVEISFDHSHLVNCVAKNFEPATTIALMGTIQFVNMLHAAKHDLEAKHGFGALSIPQASPLSMGETLGCTSPLINSSTLVFVADGRFHLESAMIMNPAVKAYRYDPYSMTITMESYDIETMKLIRYQEISTARNAEVFGLVLGTLGRQGSNTIFTRLRSLLKQRQKRAIQFLMSELNPAKIAALTDVSAWIQVACPRLSIDWGAEFKRPVLTPYEAEVAFESADWQDVYPMDYYAKTKSWGNSSI